MTGLELFLTVYGVSVVLMIAVIHTKMMASSIYNYIKSDGAGPFIALVCMVFMPIVNTVVCYFCVGTIVVAAIINSFVWIYEKVLLKLKIVSFIRVLLGVQPLKKSKRKNKPVKVSKTNGTTN